MYIITKIQNWSSGVLDSLGVGPKTSPSMLRIVGQVVMNRATTKKTATKQYVYRIPASFVALYRLLMVPIEVCAKTHS
jgi:hypothetical protein